MKNLLNVLYFFLLLDFFEFFVFFVVDLIFVFVFFLFIEVLFILGLYSVRVDVLNINCVRIRKGFVFVELFN